MVDQSISAESQENLTNTLSQEFKSVPASFTNEIGSSGAQLALAGTGIETKRDGTFQAAKTQLMSPINILGQAGDTPKRRGLAGKKYQKGLIDSPYSSMKGVETSTAGLGTSREASSMLFSEDQLRKLQQQAFETVAKASNKPFQIIKRHQQKLKKYRIKNKSYNPTNIQKSANAVLTHNNEQAKEDILYLWDKENWKLKVAANKVPSRTVYSRGRQVVATSTISPPPQPPASTLPSLQMEPPRYTFDNAKLSNPNMSERMSFASPTGLKPPVEKLVKRISIISHSAKRPNLSLRRASVTQPSAPSSPIRELLQPRPESPVALAKVTPRHERDTVSWRQYKRASKRSPLERVSPGSPKRLTNKEWRELESKQETISFGETPDQERVMGLDGILDTKTQASVEAGEATPCLRSPMRPGVVLPKIRRIRQIIPKTIVEVPRATRKQSAHNYSTLGTQQNIEKFEHFTRMATQPYYYNKKGQIRINQFSLQKHKPSCRLSLAESIDQLQQVESGDILLPREGNLSQTFYEGSLSPRQHFGASLDSKDSTGERFQSRSVFPQRFKDGQYSPRHLRRSQRYVQVESKLKRLELFPSDSRSKFERFIHEELEFGEGPPQEPREDPTPDVIRQARQQADVQVAENHQFEAGVSVTTERFVTIILNGPNTSQATLSRSVVQLKMSRPFDKAKGTFLVAPMVHRQREFRDFLLQSTKLLGLNRLLKHAFLPSGKQIYSLEEFPDTLDKVYVSHLPYFFSGMASPRPSRKQDMHHKLTNLEKGRSILQKRKVQQTPSLEHIMPGQERPPEQTSPENLQQSSNLSLMIRDLMSRSTHAEEKYAKKRNIRDLIKKSSNDAQLQFELKSIQDQEESRSNRGSPTLFSRQSQTGESKREAPERNTLSIATSELAYHDSKGTAESSKFAQYVQSQRSSSVRGGKGSSLKSKRMASARQEEELEDPLFDRELYYSRNRGRQIRNEVIREEATLEEGTQGETKRETRQQILASAFNSIRQRIETDRERSDLIFHTGQAMGQILSRNHQTTTLSSCTQWLQDMIARAERDEKVADLLPPSASSRNAATITEESSADRSPMRRELLDNARALKQVLVAYKTELEAPIEQEIERGFHEASSKTKSKFYTLQHKVDTKLGSIITQNIPKLQLRSSFSRRELHALHSQFKTLCQISLSQHPDQLRKINQKAPSIGMETFISCAKGLLNFGFHQDATLERIFNAFDSDKNGVMDWEEFLLVMKTMTSSSREKKVELYLSSLQTEYGPELKYPAIRHLCGHSLARFLSKQDKALEELLDYFADYIFETLGKDKESTISLEELKEAIYKEGEGHEDARDLLLLFTCSED